MVQNLRLRAPLTMIAATVLSAGIGIPISTVFAETTNEHQVTETNPDVNPCTGEPGTLTLTYNEVDHESSNGGNHGTFTQTGTFTFVQTSDGVTYSGHFAVWGGFNSNSGGTEADTFTLTVIGTATDGSTINAHEVAHSTTNLANLVTSEFDNLTCH